MWVEPDTNMPSGESLARQILYGQRYFERAFGVRHRVCWLPDCFGFSPALPQLLRQGGLDSFLHHQGQLVGDQPLPARSLLVGRARRQPGARPYVRQPGERLQRRGAAGLHRPDLGEFSRQDAPSRNAAGGRLRRRRRRPDARMDRGGSRLARFSRPAARALVEGRRRSSPARTRAPRRRRLPVWRGEIYLELHRATLTTQSGVKRKHRRAESALVAAETVAALAHLFGAPAPRSLEPLWRTLLKNQFHDILPGSSIREVYEDAEAELDSVVAAGLAEQQRRLAAIAGRLPPGEARRRARRGQSLALRAPAARHARRRRGARERRHDPAARRRGCSIAPRSRRRPVWRSASGVSKTPSCASRLAEDGTIASLVHKPTRARSARRARQSALGLSAGQAARLGRLGHRGGLLRARRGTARARKPRHRRKLGPSRQPAHRAPLSPFENRPDARARRQRPAPGHRHMDRLARSAHAVAHADAGRGPRRAGDVRMRVRRRHTADPRQHFVGRSAVRGSRPSLRRSLRARLRPGAAQRRQIRP